MFKTTKIKLTMVLSSIETRWLWHCRQIRFWGKRSDKNMWKYIFSPNNAVQYKIHSYKKENTQNKQSAFLWCCLLYQTVINSTIRHCKKFPCFWWFPSPKNLTLPMCKGVDHLCLCWENQKPQILNITKNPVWPHQWRDGFDPLNDPEPKPDDLTVGSNTSQEQHCRKDFGNISTMLSLNQIFWQKILFLESSKFEMSWRVLEGPLRLMPLPPCGRLLFERYFKG